MYIVDVVATPVIHDFTDVLAASVTKREGSTSSLAAHLRGAQFKEYLGEVELTGYCTCW